MYVALEGGVIMVCWREGWVCRAGGRGDYGVLGVCRAGWSNGGDGAEVAMDTARTQWQTNAQSGTHTIGVLKK